MSQKLDPKLAATLESLLENVQDAVRERVVPRVLIWSADSETGCVTPSRLSKNDALGSLSAQAGALHTLGTMMRYAFEAEAAGEMAVSLVEGLESCFWDTAHGGWFDDSAQETKSALGQGLALAGLCEYVMATGSFSASELCVDTFQTVQTFLADNESGGYWTRSNADWSEVTRDSGEVEGNAALLLGFDAALQTWGSGIYSRKCRELANWLGARESLSSASPISEAIYLSCAGLHNFPAKEWTSGGRHLAESAETATVIAVARRALEAWTATGNSLHLNLLVELDCGQILSDFSPSGRTGAPELDRALQWSSMMRIEELLLRTLY